MKKNYGIEGLFNRPTGIDVTEEQEPETKEPEKEPEVTSPRSKGRPKKAVGERVIDKNEFVTFQADKETMAKIRAIAGKENLTIKNILDTALSEIVRRYEEKHGPVATNNRQKSEKTLLDLL